MNKYVSLTAGLVALMFLAGCNSTSQSITTLSTNGTPMTLKAHTWNMLQADQSVGKIRVSDAKTSRSIGVADITQKSDIATAFEGVGMLAKDLAGAFASVQSGGLVKPATTTTPSGSEIVPESTAGPITTFPTVTLGTNGTQKIVIPGVQYYLKVSTNGSWILCIPGAGLNGSEACYIIPPK